jgi:hypothetical protein
MEHAAAHTVLYVRTHYPAALLSHVVLSLHTARRPKTTTWHWCWLSSVALEAHRDPQLLRQPSSMPQQTRRAAGCVSHMLQG